MLDSLCDVLRESYKKGWISTRDGNGSVRYTSREYFQVTPSGEKKWKLDAEDCIKLKWDAFLESGKEILPKASLCNGIEVLGETRGKKPTGEYLLHAYLQRKTCDQNRVVLHVHPTYIISAMYKGIDLRKISEEFPEINRYTRVGPVLGNIAPISVDLAVQSVRALELDEKGNIQYDIIGLDRHGIVSVAADPWSAFEHVERLEHICQIVLASGKTP